MSDAISMAVSETEQIILGTIDKLKQVGIENRLRDGLTRKEFHNGYIQALIDLKEIMN